MFGSKYFPDYLRFFLIIVLTVVFTYFTPRILAVIWYLILLIWYYRSSDEPFWLVIFLTTTDGFMSFMGLYEVTLPVLPGLPAIELIQFYIILSFIKASRIKAAPYIFFNRLLILIGLYIIFMIVWGQMMGFSEGINGYFRLAKLTLPLLLFYSVPRHFRSMAFYERLLRFIFILLMTGFITQLFTLLVGQSPAGLFNVTVEKPVEPGEFRGFYNMAAILIGLLGALFYVAYGQKGKFNEVYLYVLIFSAFGMALLSATRGWIISFGLIILLSLFIGKFKINRMIGFIIIIGTLSYLGWSNAKIREQVLFSQERLESLGALTEGDITAGGTLKRLNVRGPRVMAVWKENPIFGWGFSDVSRRYNDGHVANQNLLMASGVAGVILLTYFFIYFSIRMIERYIFLPKHHLLKSTTLVFIVFLWGWVFIHSTSGQHFSYGGIPLLIVPQAVFFSFGALIYRETFKLPGRRNID